MSGGWHSGDPPTSDDEAAAQGGRSPWAATSDADDYDWWSHSEWPSFRWPPSSEQARYGQVPRYQTERAPVARDARSHDPLRKLFPGLSHGTRVFLDWVLTIAGAILIVLAVKHWVVNPYRIPSSSMEPTLHCARPAPGCEARFSDRVLANRFIYHFENPARGDVVVFTTPPAAKAKCGAGGTFVKRIIGLPGETVQIRVLRGAAYVFIDGRRLEEPYIQHDRRDIGPAERFKVPLGHYFMMGDNRSQSCDSRVWGSVPRENLIGKVFMTYWPPQRISFR